MVAQTTPAHIPSANKSRKLRYFDSIRRCLPYLSIFLLALLLRLWFALFDGHAVIYTAGDASEYLRGARLLGEFFTGAAPSKPLAEFLSQGGPVYPLMILIGQTTLGQLPFFTETTAPIALQCIFSAVTCVLIGAIGARCWDTRVGYYAAILAAFYPGFIVNSARLLSETLACFLLCVTAIFTISAFNSRRLLPALLSGVAAALLQSTRSVLVLANAAALLLLTLVPGARTRTRLVGAFLAGIVIVVLPIMAFTQLSTGNSQLVPDRKGLYNLIVGLNHQSRGWLCYPYPSFVETVGGNFASVIRNRIAQSPQTFTAIMLDKPLRLLKHPWNDFKTPIGPIKFGSQVVYHQACLLLAAVGLALGFFRTSDQVSTYKSAIGSRSFLIALLALHCTYFFFSTITRYGSTAMPIVLILSAVGLRVMYDLLRAGSSRRIGLALCVSTVLLFLVLTNPDTIGLIGNLPFVPSFTAALVIQIIAKVALAAVFLCVLLFAGRHVAGTVSTRVTSCVISLAIILFAILPLTAHGSSTEWSVSLNRNRDSITQVISIPKEKAELVRSGACYVLIDCENWQGPGQLFTISVNGITLPSVLPFTPLIQDLSQMKQNGPQRNLECEHVFSMMLAAAGGTNLNLRQWFVALVPEEITAAAISNNQPFTIQIRRNAKAQPKLYGSYITRSEQAIIPSLGLISWDKCLYGVENGNGFSDQRFVERLKVPGLLDDRQDLSSQPGIQTGTYNVRLLLASKNQLQNETTTRVGSRTTNGSGFNTVHSLIPPAEFDKETLWLVSFEGTIESDSQSGETPVFVSARVSAKAPDGSTVEYDSPWVPSSMLINQGTTPVRFGFPFRPAALGERIDSVKIQFKPGGRALENQFFSVKNASLSTSDLTWSEAAIKLRQMAGNPIKATYEVF